MKNNLLILGSGGHGRVVKETAEAMGIFNKIDFLDDNPDSNAAIAVCSDNKGLTGEYRFAFAAFGNNELRMKWIDELQKNGFRIPVLIHPRAFISPSAKISYGTIICAAAVVNTNSYIDTGCIISAGAVIDHDTEIGYGCHIDCGATVKSNCRIKAYTKVESGMAATSEVMPKPKSIIN